MLKLIKLSIVLIFCTTNFCNAQQVNKSILDITPTKFYNISVFNNTLKQEIKPFNLSIYSNLDPVFNGDIMINTRYFNKKKTSKYAYEDLNEVVFFRSLLPKPIKFDDFYYLTNPEKL